MRRVIQRKHEFALLAITRGTGNQSRDSDSARFNVAHGLGDLTELAPHHVFMAKLTYWWSPS